MRIAEGLRERVGDQTRFPRALLLQVVSLNEERRLGFNSLQLVFPESLQIQSIAPGDCLERLLDKKTNKSCGLRSLQLIALESLDALLELMSCKSQSYKPPLSPWLPLLSRATNTRPSTVIFPRKFE